MWQRDLFPTVPDTFTCNHLEEDGLTPLFYKSVPYRGRETRVFAWLGLPDGASQKNKVPAVVLVHGGGGTAFFHWVKLWNSRGYAAIAMDTCGAMPTPHNTVYGGVTWPRHAWSGPNGWGALDQADDKPEDQWFFHAVHAIARGHSLLASLPEVDESRIGITGVSWGGVLTCLSASLDDRYICAAPVYGCGFISEESTPELISNLAKLDSEKREFWKNNWDPAAHLSQAKCSILWYNGTNDYHFHPTAWQKSAKLVSGESRMCMKLRWPHGHGKIGENMEELAVFMAAELKNEKPYPKVTKTEIDKNQASATLAPGADITGAQLAVTFDSDSVWPEKEWHLLSAEWNEKTLTANAKIPEGATSAYLQFMDSRKIYLSSDRVDF